MTTKCQCGANAYVTNWETNIKACANCGKRYEIKAGTDRNRYDVRGSLEAGRAAEEKFIQIAIKNGFEVGKTTYSENAFEHFDYYIIKEDKMTRVEVKAMKRIDAWDSEVQDKWLWIELHGVRPTDKGWLEGKADMIAFEQSDHFILVKRTDLRELVELLITHKTVERPSQAQYKIYQRRGRCDKITIIKTQDLNQIRKYIWR